MPVKEGYVTLPEVKEILEAEAKQRELGTEQKYAVEHSQRFSRADDKKSRKLVAELLSEIEGLNETIAIKIADVMPKDAEDLRVLFAKERAGAQKKDTEKILAIVEKYG